MKNIPQKIHRFAGYKTVDKLRLIKQIFILLLIGIATLNNIYGQCTNPYSQTLVGGGALGSNGSTTITMISNQIGVTYQLKSGSTFIGNSVTGTGTGVINWTVSSVGTYSAWSLAQGGFCSVQIGGTINVTAYVPPPPVIASLNVASGISGADVNGPYQSICSGAAASVTVSPVNGGTAPTYQWYKNSIAISGATGTSYSSTAFVNGDKLSVTMTSNDPNANPKTASVSINIVATNKVTPSVSLTSSNGSNPSICAGKNLTFTASTTSPCSYKWKVNDVEQTGQTTNTFSTSSLTNGQTVSVEISTSNACQTTNFASNATTVTVNPNLPVSVSISGETSLCDGFGAFTASTTNGGSNAGIVTSYQWKVKPAGSGTFSNVTNLSAGGPEYMYIPSTSLNDGDVI